MFDKDRPILPVFLPLWKIHASWILHVTTRFYWICDWNPYIAWNELSLELSLLVFSYNSFEKVFRCSLIKSFKRSRNCTYCRGLFSALKTVNYFRKKTPSWMFDWILKTHLVKCSKSSCQRCSTIMVFLKILHLPRKTLTLESLVRLQACSFIKKRLQHRRFPVNFAKFLRTSILKNICALLLLPSNIFELGWIFISGKRNSRKFQKLFGAVYFVEII